MKIKEMVIPFPFLIYIVMNNYETLNHLNLPSRGLFYPTNVGIKVRRLNQEEIIYIRDEINAIKPTEDQIIEYKIIVIFFKLINKFNDIFKFSKLNRREILKIDILYLFLYLINITYGDRVNLANYKYVIDDYQKFFNKKDKCFDVNNSGYKYRPITISSFLSFINFYVQKKDDINCNFIHFLPLLKSDLSYKEMIRLDELYQSLENYEQDKIVEVINYMKNIYKNEFYTDNNLVNIDYQMVKFYLQNLKLSNTPK